VEEEEKEEKERRRVMDVRLTFELILAGGLLCAISALIGMPNKPWSPAPPAVASPAPPDDITLLGYQSASPNTQWRSIAVLHDNKRGAVCWLLVYGNTNSSISCVADGELKPKGTEQ
jgi:hypothetical protein